MLRCPGVGNCQVLKSRGGGIYYILAKKYKSRGYCPGGMVTAGIDPCITYTRLFTDTEMNAASFSTKICLSVTEMKLEAILFLSGGE